jgi:DGQHR domain-containing protein
VNQDIPIQIQALRVRQPIGEFFVASMPAKTLVQISFADVRRLAGEDREVEMYLGIQRKIDNKRMKDLRRYIQSSDATFPTAVILSVDERCAEYDESTSTMVLSSLPPDPETGEEGIPRNKIARVLDGQHRIAAFLTEDGKWRSECDGIDFDVNVAIFIGADISEQANVFATVNLAQTKVNKSLVYDLTELAKTRSPHRTCHDTAVSLDTEPRSPFFHRIKRLGTATPERKDEPLTQASFVEALCPFITIDPFRDRDELLRGKKLPRATAEELAKTPFRNLFLDEHDVDIAEILFKYFSAVRDKWPNSWVAVNQTGNLLPRSNAFKAFMKFLHEDVYPKVVGTDYGRVPTKKEFSRFFEPIDVRDEDFTTRHFAPGSTGQARFLKMLRREISLADMLKQE